MSQSRMAPSLAKRFRSGRPGLDFAHTGSSRPEWVEPELIADVAGLERWLAHILQVESVRAGVRDVAAAHRLRAAVWELAHARIEGRPLPADAVRTLNAYAAAVPPVPHLTSEGELAAATPTAAAALSAIARDTIDLLTGPLGQRIHVCAAEGCELLFVDASRPGTRRWCSMQRCGNLAKIHTHRNQPARS